MFPTVFSDIVLLATLAVAAATLWRVHGSGMGRGGRHVASMGAEDTSDPEAATQAPSSDVAGVPKELTAAWVQFLRDDLAKAVNGLNGRLNVISNIVAQLERGAFAAHNKDDLAQIEIEVDRASKITGGLLHRVTVGARDMPPPVWNVLRDRPVRMGHILVVEDDDANRGVITRLFRRLGHKVTAASNGIEAFEVLEEGSVDCVICDLRMPYLGGKGLFEQVERRLPHYASRFVFVTGDYTRPVSREFLLVAGQPVIGKPYEIETMLAAVATVLTSVGVLTDDS